MAELESYLKSILSQGEKVSSGFFSLDLAAARRKMGHFFAPNQQALFAAQLLTAALRGQEDLPDQDLSRLTSTQRASLLELLDLVCARSAKLAVDRYSREFQAVKDHLAGRDRFTH